MIDLHAHVLPGLDDGSTDIDTSLRMMAIAEEEGITAIAATTHYIPGTVTHSPEFMRSEAARFQDRLNKEDFRITISVVHELQTAAGISDWLRSGEVLSYDKGGRYILLEMPTTEVPNWMDQLVGGLLREGIIPVLAHPERNKFVKENPRIIYELVASGCLTQLTSSSVLGKWGRRAKAVSEMMLAHSLVHIVASDAHDDEERAPRMKESRAAVTALTDEPTARALYEDNPRFILSGQPIVPPPIREIDEPLPPTKMDKFRRLFT